MPPGHRTGPHSAPVQQPGSMARPCDSPGAIFRQASARTSGQQQPTMQLHFADSLALDSSSCRASELFLCTSCRLCKAHLQAALASPMESAAPHAAHFAGRLLHILLISPALIIPRSAILQGEAVQAGSSLHLAPLLLWRGAAANMLHWWLILQCHLLAASL